eukprot:365511-Chlamydomonas_euryale.AAC.9
MEEEPQDRVSSTQSEVPLLLDWELHAASGHQYLHPWWGEPRSACEAGTASNHVPAVCGCQPATWSANCLQFCCGRDVEHATRMQGNDKLEAVSNNLLQRRFPEGCACAHTRSCSSIDEYSHN